MGGGSSVSSFPSSISCVYHGAVVPSPTTTMYPMPLLGRAIGVWRVGGGRDMHFFLKGKIIEASQMVVIRSSQNDRQSKQAKWSSFMFVI